MIIAAMCYIEPYLTLIASSTILIAYLVISVINKYKLNLYSIQLQNNSFEIIKILQECLGSIREIILDKSHQYHLNKCNGKMLNEFNQYNGKKEKYKQN
jgi:ABC-type bacteriocin/lantibiotic exporter with double-glycine peptidase domain